MKQSFNVGTGTSSILLIFVVLALTAMGVLSLVSARASYALSLRNVEMVEQYYTADAQVELALADLDSALAVDNDVPQSWMALEEGKYRLSVDMNDRQAIYTTVELTQEGQTSFRVLERALYQTGEWAVEGDFSLFH